jgi:hypothetical protein
MTTPARPQSGAVPQPWKPEQARAGVTCPACGLANQDGARVCRNCGLPIAAADDPVRGVAPGRVDMPSTQRSGLSAMVGLALVVGLLLVAGTLAVSGGGILNSGGRLGAGTAPDASAATDETVSSTVDDGSLVDEVSGVDTADAGGETVAAVGTSIDDYTCDDGAIKDLSRRRWDLGGFSAGSRIPKGFDQVSWTLDPIGRKKAKGGTTVTMEWMSPQQAKSTYQVPRRVQGNRALVVTFDGPIDINITQAVDSLSLEPEGVQQIRNIQQFVGSDNKVHTVLGLRSQSCARLEAKGWERKSKAKQALLLLQVERFDS